MIRLIITLLFVVIYLILSVFAWLFLDIVGLFSKEKKDSWGFKNVCWAFGIVYRLAGAKPTVVGLENVPTDEPILYVANHQSFFDVVMAYAFCPTTTGFLSKDTFSKVPLLARWMKKNYCIFLTRTDPRADLKLIIKAQDQIKDGISMFVFPEGTRSKDGSLAEFHEASLRLATKTGCKIVPVAITNTRNIFESHLPFLRKTKCIFTYMDPIDIKTLEGDDKKYVGAYCRRLIEEQLEKDAKLLETL